LRGLSKVMTPSGSEVASHQEEVDLLRRQVDRLHEIVAELLAKNQHLREALEVGPVHVRSLGASEMKFTASFVYAPGDWGRGRIDRGEAEGDD
jgi:hypothetical protein